MSMVLVTAGRAAHALLDERGAPGDALAQVILLPRVLGGARPLALHRVVDVRNAMPSPVGELRDVRERDQREAVGHLREILRKLPARVRRPRS